MKRYIYIIIGAVVVVVIAALIFWFLAQGRTPSNNGGQTGSLPNVGVQSGGTGASGGNSGGIGGNTGTTGGDQGGSGTGQVALLKSFGIVSNDPVLDYFVDPQNNVTALETNGSIEQISNGQSSALSTSTFTNIISSDFAYNGKKVLVSFGSSLDSQTNVFDVASKSWFSLPANAQSARWSPSDYRIAYLTSPATGTMSLSIVDASSAKKVPTALITLAANDLSLQWLNKTQVLLSDKPSSFTAGSLWLFDLVKKTLTPVITEVPGLESVWNGTLATGTTEGLALSSNGEPGGSLQLYDISGKALQSFKFTTLPSKCTFGLEPVNTSSSTATSSAKTAPSLDLFCGVPRDQNGLSYYWLPDDYNQTAFFTSDNFYRINLSTGAIDQIWNDAAQNIDAAAVKFFNSTLFFVNRYNQKLYGMVLNQTQTAQGD